MANIENKATMQITIDVSGFSAAEIEDIKAHIRGRSDGPEHYNIPYHGWVCFHCGETFKTVFGAEMHFGKTPKEKPLCIDEKRRRKIEIERTIDSLACAGL